MKRIISQFKSVRRQHERGTIMILTAVAITAMIGMVALAIDLGFLFSLRNQYQNGIDAAALAASSGLRVTIEEDPGAPQQALIVRQLAKKFASYNEARRFKEPPQVPGEIPPPSPNAIVLEDSAITLDTTTDIPKVTVDSTILVPTLFAGIVGFYEMNIRGRAMASLFPVDGGTGTLAAGIRGMGCWRPIFLPDTFYDSNNVLRVLFEEEEIDKVERDPPLKAGDYYRSRFAAGARNAPPFIDAIEGVRGVREEVTGLRDTPLAAEIGTKTIMGKQMVRFKAKSYFVADFASRPRITFDEYSLGEFAEFGYCGQIRVGDQIPVFPRGDALRVAQVYAGLNELINETIGFDFPLPAEESLYRYVSSNLAPDPNTHGAIIPVLFYDPFLYNKSPTTLTVTNFGLFLLKKVDSDGSLNGYFVREIIAGGTPIAAANFQGDDPLGFRRSWLPMAVQLLR